MPRFALSLAALFLVAGCGSNSDSSHIFELVIRNTATPATFETTSGQQAVIAYAAAVGVVHSGANPLYTIGQPAPANGLELYAEDADSSELFMNLSQDPTVDLSLLGVQPIEEGSNAGVLGPQNSYRIVFNVEDTSAKLSLILQFLQSNDVFLGTVSDGIELFDDSGTPLAQDITSQLQLLDAGTEANEAPGEGSSQTSGQPMPKTGTTESNVVRPVDDGFGYPPIAGNLQVTITPVDELD